MQKINVGVLRGGPSSEYDISLKTGQRILQELPEAYDARDILLTKSGGWHIDGVETTPAKLHGRVDVIFNATHGQYGEDGKVQQLLDSFSIPYTGSGPLASALAMNKFLAKERFKKMGIKTPHGLTLTLSEGEGNWDENLSLEIFRKIAPSWVVKPISAGSSKGMTIVKQTKDLPEAIREARKHGNQVLVEEFIRGQEVTCGVIDNFRGQKHYSLIPISTRQLSTIEKKAIQDMAVRIHETLGLKHYSETDFIISPRGIYVLETNSQPALHHEALFPKALEAIGSSYPAFLKHVIDMAIIGV
ncbi:MAG: ATP-grasp domain-containing protein [Candidatus Paceibacterota bacterium]|jgi:D-alanine-D-alanine ligase